MNKRVKMVRKALHISQQEFANRIGLKRCSISSIETNAHPPSEQTILNICREFSINEHWLRTGEGEMFTKEQRNTLEELKKKMELSDSETKFLIGYFHLNIHQRELFCNCIQNIVRNIKLWEQKENMI